MGNSSFSVVVPEMRLLKKYLLHLSIPCLGLGLLPAQALVVNGDLVNGLTDTSAASGNYAGNLNGTVDNHRFNGNSIADIVRDEPSIVISLLP
jgi:hypothetical protein